MSNGWIHKDRKVDPTSIFKTLRKNKAEPQGQIDFKIPELEKQPNLKIANFKNLIVNN